MSQTRLTADQLHALADDAFEVLNWARRCGFTRPQQVNEVVKAFEVRLGYREPATNPSTEA